MSMNITVKYNLKWLFMWFFPAVTLSILFALSVVYEWSDTFYITLILGVVPVCAFLLCLKRFIVCLWLNSRVQEKKYQDAQRKGVHGCGGGTRTGKSLSEIQSIGEHALAQWNDVIYKYYLYDYFTDDWAKNGNEKKLEEFDEYAECFSYYTDHPDLLPCVRSNIPIEYNGQVSHPLTGKNLLQIDRVPPYTDALIDENSQYIPIDMYKDRPLDLDEFVRCFGHFVGDSCVFTYIEQDPQGSYIGIRRPAVYVRYMLKQEIRYSPRWLEKRVDKLKQKFVKQIQKATVSPDSHEKPTKAQALRLYNLEQYCNKIGFREMHFVTMGNTENKIFHNVEVETEYEYREIEFHYDTRAYKPLYKCKDESLKYEPFSDMQLSADRFRKWQIKLEKDAEKDFWNSEEIKDKNLKYRDKYPDKYIDYLARPETPLDLLLYYSATKTELKGNNGLEKEIAENYAISETATHFEKDPETVQSIVDIAKYGTRKNSA